MIVQKKNEYSFFYKNKEYVLSPVLGALSNIENELGYTIPKMLSKWNTRGILTSEAVVVFKNTLISNDNEKLYKKLIKKKDFLNLIKMVIPTFINSFTEKSNNNDNIWDEMFAVAVLHMGIDPKIFWQMTLNDFLILSKYYEQSQKEQVSITDNDVRDLKNFINQHKWS